MEMQVNNIQPVDLLSQLQGLLDSLAAERTAREAAETANAAKSELLGVVGRELRAPMETTISMAELLLTTHLDPIQRKHTEALATSARSLLATLGDVLDFVALEEGEAELAIEGFDLHALVREAASVLQARAGAKGLMTGVDMAANCPQFIVGDVKRVRQVVMGLVELALRETTEGSIRLYVSINDAQTPHTVRFDVTDTGAGLSAEEQENLFRPSNDPARAGGRLGLPIARRLAEAMGGEVGCDSALGQGTLYWFTFQTVVADDMDEGDDALLDLVVLDNEDAPEASTAAPKVAPKPEPEVVKAKARKGALSGHVLLVEDNMVNRMLIAAYLQEFGLTHEVAETGAAALMCLAARDYDLVLTDTTLPDYNGEQIAKRIRALQGAAAQVPIVALAAPGEKDNEQDYVAAGMNARVTKPIQGRGLYAALVPYLQASGASQSMAKAS